MINSYLQYLNENIDNIIKSFSMVLFHAEWASPSRAMKKEIKKIYSKNKLKMNVVDVDVHKDIAKKYNIKVVPTLLIFNKGKVLERIEGIISNDHLDEIIKTNKNKRK